MFLKILLPLDLADKHQAAVRVAAELARQNRGTVTLLHVVELIPGLEQEEEKAFYDRLERRAREHLAGMASGLSGQGVSCRVEVILGHRIQDTIRHAAEEKVDLIILTAPAFEPERPALSLGSMAWRISLMAPCPILLVKG